MVRRLEKQREQAPSRTSAGSSHLPVSGQLRKQTKSPNKIEERIGTWTEINITDHHTYARKAPPPPSTDSFSVLASGAAEMYLESEEWVMEDPGDWAIILAEMRKNVQSRAASLLGHVPTHDRRDSGHHPRNISHNPKQSGSKVYIRSCSHRCCPLQNSSNSMIGRLSVYTEQPNARVTTSGDPAIDANRVIYPP